MDDYLIEIGKKIKEIRKSQNQTINQIASKALVSKGLISKIENGRTIPSLPVLLSIIEALEVQVSSFFKDITNTDKTNYLVFRNQDYPVIEKEEAAQGFEYRSVFSKQFSSCSVQAVLLEVKPGSIREKVETDAFEFKYIISGSCTYIIDQDHVEVHTGDSIVFDGRIPHVPINHTKQSCLMLVLYFYYQNEN